MDRAKPRTCPVCSGWVAQIEAVTVDGQSLHPACAVKLRRQSTKACVICGGALAAGEGLVFRGDDLIHAGCLGSREATA